MLVKFCFILSAFMSLAESSGRKPKLVDTKTTSYLAKTGSTIRLKCVFYRWGKNWKMTWYKDGVAITVQRKARFRMRNGRTGILRIRKSRIEDAGMYRCLASNEYGTESKQMNLTVTASEAKRGVRGQGPPWFIKQMPPKQYIAWPASNDLKMRCAADGEPPLKYQWLKDGKVQTYRRLDPKFSSTKWYLRIKTAVPSDNGLYRCIVSNRLGNISHDYKLAVIEKGQIRPVLSSRFPVNKTARVGDNVTFQCIELFGPMLTDYYWLHWKKLPPSYPDLKPVEMPSANSSYYKLINPRHYKAFDVEKKDGKYGGRVYINNVTKEDAGMYTCVVANHIGKSWRSAFLRVVGSERKPFFTHPGRMEKRTMIKPAGNNLKAVCLAAGIPSPTVVWYKNGKPMKLMPDGVTPMTPTSFVLEFDSLRPKDNGKYECFVSNKLGNVSASYELIVKEMIIAKPVLLKMENKTAYEGDNVKFTCRAISDALPHFQWIVKNEKNNSLEVLDPGLEQDEYICENDKPRWHCANLQLVNVSRKDEREYYCVAGDNRGYSMETVWLKVLPRQIAAEEVGKPEFAPDSYVANMGSTVRLKCAFTDWRVEWTMTWYKRGQILRLPTNGRFRSLVGKSSFLVINRAQNEDAGIYECVASSEHGTVKRKLELTIRGQN